MTRRHICLIQQVSTVHQTRHLSRLFAVVAAGLALLPALACRPRAIGTDVVVTVEGDEIHYSEFESYLRESVDSSDLPLGRTVLDQLFDQFLDERLLVRLAMDRGLPGGEPADGTARIDQHFAITFLLRQEPAPRLSEAELLAHYDAHREEYQRPASVRLHQILVQERPQAVAVIEALDRGEDFAEVAARFSQVPIRPLGDEEGRLAREDLPEAFADLIFELEPGTISGIIDADYGFHIFEIVERLPASDVPFDEVAGKIRQVLERRSRDALVVSFVEESRRRYNVRIHLSNFPFDYRGFYAQDNKT